MKILLVVILFFSTQCSAKLVYESLRVNGKSILYIKDGALVKKGGGGITAGDAARVRSQLSRKKYSEIWLYSGGGNLAEGVKIGTYLRQSGAFVRVKKGDYCVSACTVAFLGGLFRTIDEGASYEVHAYSGVLRGFRTKKDEQRLLSDPKTFLSAYAQKELNKNSVYWSTALFEYFRLMIQPIPTAKLQTVFGSARHNYLKRQIQQYANTAYSRYLKEQLNKDVARIAREGIAAGHDIVMRLERDSMSVAINGLLELDNKINLGHRSKYAIRMLQTMFESNILSTSQLSLETLREYGYTNVASQK